MSEDLTKKLPTTDSEKISLILTTVQHLETRVDKLEKKVEERLYDTRPIWEKVVADIAQLQSGQLQLQEGQQRLEGEVHEIKISMRDVFRRMSVLNDNQLKTQGDVREVIERLGVLEARQQNPTNSQT